MWNTELFFRRPTNRLYGTRENDDNKITGTAHTLSADDRIAILYYYVETKRNFDERTETVNKARAAQTRKNSARGEDATAALVMLHRNERCGR